MSQWVVHRDPRWFDRPLEFQPDRWTAEFLAGLPKYAYFPFGGGPRQCIGNYFAMMEVVLLMATLNAPENVTPGTFRATVAESDPAMPVERTTKKPVPLPDESRLDTRITTGPPALPVRRAATSKPSMSGSITSSSTTSGRSRPASVRRR